jgi:ABC-type glycerol-3-phosphate transport system substrate-binding protein
MNDRLRSHFHTGSGPATRRGWLAHAVALAGGATAAACGANGTSGASRPPASAPPAELAGLSWISDPAAQQRLQATADAFHAQQPNVTVSWAFAGGSGGVLLEKLLATMAGGAPPDVSMMQEAWVPQLGTDAQLLVLDSYLKSSKVDVGDFVPALRQYMGFGDGKTRYLPWYAAPVALFSNDAQAKEAGLAAPPRSWDELVQHGQRLVKTDGATVTRSGLQLGTADWVWLPFLWGNGGQFDQNGKVVQNSPQGIEALQFFTDAVRRHRIQGLPAPAGGFDAGNVSMAVDGAWNIPARRKLQGLQFATAPIPAKQPGPAPHPVRMEGMLAFTRKATDAATWQYLEYLLTPPVMIKYATESGFVPARTSARRSGQFAAFLAQEPAMKAPTEGIESPGAKAMPLLRGWMQIKPVIAKMITEAQAGERSAKDILDDYTRQIQDLAR